jgi:hypothetical protein
MPGKIRERLRGTTRIRRHHRPLLGSCTGKKNWLFIGHPKAGQRSAILYSLIVSCQRHGKAPLYLCYPCP